MLREEISKMLSDLGVLITNSHIVYTSGKHGTAYFNKDGIYPHTEVTSRVCGIIASWFKHDDVQVVAAPAIGGVILSQWIAYHMSTRHGQRPAIVKKYPGLHVIKPVDHHREVLAVYAEKSETGFIIKRGYDQLLTGRNVLVMEDVLTTGGSVVKVVEATRACGGNVIGVGALCNRGGVTAETLGVPKLESLVNISLDSWDAKACPLCKDNVPINTTVGKGREFLARQHA